MVVEVTNVTDGPGRTPTQVDIYNKTLDPGATIKLPAELVDAKVRKLEERGLICIGRVPPWYASAKTRRGRRLSTEEMQTRIRQPKAAPPLAKADIKREEPTKAPEEATTEETDRKKKR